MSFSLATLWHERSRFLPGILAVAFSALLIAVQGGLLLGLLHKASVLVDYGQADLWVGHRHMNNVDMGTFIPERWIHRIRGLEGVEHRARIATTVRQKGYFRGL